MVRQPSFVDGPSAPEERATIALCALISPAAGCHPYETTHTLSNDATAAAATRQPDRQAGPVEAGGPGRALERERNPYAWTKAADQMTKALICVIVLYMLVSLGTTLYRRLGQTELPRRAATF